MLYHPVWSMMWGTYTFYIIFNIFDIQLTGSVDAESTDVEI